MPELRKDPIIGRWVIISTERAKRPDDFKHAPVAEVTADEPCPFCQGNEDHAPDEIAVIRDSGNSGWAVRTIPSIRPLLHIDGAIDSWGEGMYDVLTGFGAHEVIVETPEHTANMADLEVVQIKTVLTMYAQRLKDLEQDDRLQYALIYKNYGQEAGGGMHNHTRSHLIATPVIPKWVKEELVGSRQHYEHHDRCIFCDIIRQEQQQEVRLVYENDDSICICPFASRFPFEVWILPKTHSCDFHSSSESTLTDIARSIKIILSKLKQGLHDPAYNCVLHVAPFKRKHYGYWTTIQDDYHWHIEITPRLTRIAGFEWGTGFYICPTPPEDAAKFLRDVKV